MSDERAHRWRNSSRPGGTFFITSSCLEREPRLRSSEAKDVVTRSFLQTSLSLGVHLGHYVVLSNHLHLLAYLPEGLTVGRYVQILKVRAHARLGEKGSLWEEGYRGLNIDGERFRLQKIDYIQAIR